MNIATTFCSTGIPSVFLHPSEAQHGDLGILQKNDLLLLISNSGKTREIVELTRLAHNLDPDLIELGEAQKLAFGDGKDHFDADTSLHYHFVCRSCGAVTDLPMEPLADIDQRAQSCTADQIEDHTVFFFGRCANCFQKEGH